MCNEEDEHLVVLYTVCDAILGNDQDAKIVTRIIGYTATKFGEGGKSIGVRPDPLVE